MTGRKKLVIAGVGLIAVIAVVGLNAARGEGAGGVLFLTDVDLQNAGTGVATFQFLWLPRDTDNRDPIRSDVFTLAPGASTVVADVVGTADVILLLKSLASGPGNTTLDTQITVGQIGLLK